MVLQPRPLQQQSVKATTTSDPFHHANRDSVKDADTDTSPTPLIPSNYSANYFDTSQLKEGQDRDPDIQNIIRRLHHKPNSLPFIFKDNLLRRLISPFPHCKTKSNVIYLPSSMIESLLYACHNDPMTGGHFSLDRTYNKIKNLYWWPKMKLSIFKHIKSCLSCQQYNISRQKKHGQLRPISPVVRKNMANFVQSPHLTVPSKLLV